MNTYIYISSGFALLAAIAHSAIGEVKLFRSNTLAAESGILKSRMWQRVVRAVWHLPSMCWIVVALMTTTLVREGTTPRTAFYFASAIYLLSSIGNLIATRGKSPGWVVLLAAAIPLWL